METLAVAVSGRNDERLVVANPAPSGAPTSGDPTSGDPAALSLFRLGDISHAMDIAAWNVQEEIALLVELAQDTTVRASIRMEAAARIREIAKEGAIMEGYIQRLTMTEEQHTDSTGQVTTTTRVEGDKFLSDPSETLRKLQAGMEIQDKQPQLCGGSRRAPRLTPDPDPGPKPKPKPDPKPDPVVSKEPNNNVSPDNPTHESPTPRSPVRPGSTLRTPARPGDESGVARP